MRGNTLTTGSWIALIIAVLAWAGVGFFLMFLMQMQDERSQYLADAAAANVQEGQAAQLRVLARETEDDRATLSTIANLDVLSAVNLIESVSASGTPVHVTSAQPVKSNSKAGSQLNVVDLTAHAEGSFASIMNIVQMLESLPIPTAVQEIDLSHAPADSKSAKPTDPWSLLIRLRFYTTATLSS